MKYLTRFNKLSDYIGNIDNLEYPSTSYIDEDETVRYGLPSELTDKVKAIWIPYGKSNEDEDRDIIYDLSGNGNNLELTGFQWTKDSGYSEYSIDFLDWRSNSKMNFTSSKLTSTTSNLPGGWLTFRNASGLIPETKVKVSGAPREFVFIGNNNDGDDRFSVIINNGVYTIPEFTLSSASGFYINNNSGDWSKLVIEQIPDNEHALITSGSSDELISSKDSISRITGNSDTITVLSVVENLDEKEIFVNFIGGDLYGNNIRNSILTDSGICVSGYSGTSEDENPTLINTILGDKSKIKFIDKYRLTENNKILINKGTAGAGDYKLSWYGTIIAAGELSEYEMCTLLGYYILDRLIKPVVYYDVKRQGITNDNHSKFNDKLKDFSGYGRDIQLNNIAWKGYSGIGKYNFSNINIIASRFEGTVTTNKCHFTKKLTNTTNNFCDLIVISPNEPIKFKVSGLSDGRKLFVANKSGSGSNYNFDNGEHEVSLSFPEGVIQNNPFGVTGDIGDIDVTVEFIPSHAGALCLDGIDDSGRVDGLPTLTDYTVVSTREWIRTTGYTDGAALSSKRNNLTTGGETGDFMIEVVSNSDSIHSYSYGGENRISSYFNPNKSTIYQTKYSYNGSIDLTVGTQSPTDTLLLGERGPGFGFANIAIYNFLLYPYSLNSYLIDRQLKKLKLGSLNFNSVVWYPIVNSPILIDSIEYIHIKGNEITQIEQNKLYNYEDSTLKIIIDTYDQFNISSVLVNGVECSSDVPGTYTTPFPTTSPQSISIITNNDSFVLDASNRWDSNGIWKSTGIFRY